MAALALESGDSGVDLAETPACECRGLRCENTGDSGLGILGRSCQVGQLPEPRIGVLPDTGRILWTAASRPETPV